MFLLRLDVSQVNGLTSKKLLCPRISAVHQRMIFLCHLRVGFCVRLIWSHCLKQMWSSEKQMMILTLIGYLGGFGHYHNGCRIKDNIVDSEWLSGQVQLWFLPQCTDLSALLFISNAKIWRLQASLFVLKGSGGEWMIQMLFVGQHERLLWTNGQPWTWRSEEWQKWRAWTHHSLCPNVKAALDLKIK